MRRPRIALLGSLAALAAVLAAGAPTVAEEPSDSFVDEGPARSNPLDPDLLPGGLRDGRRAFPKGVEDLRDDGSDGFRTFGPSYAFGAYHLQLVSSGADGDVEVLRPAATVAAAELTTFLNMQFTVDPGLTPRNTAVGRFPAGFCGGLEPHECSMFPDDDPSLGVIRIEISDYSPCGELVPAGTARGTVGCGGPESFFDLGFTYNARGNVWLSASLTDVNADRAAAILAHEVGHTLGLDHFVNEFSAIPGATPTRQLMFPALHDDPSDLGTLYRSGDVQGLWYLNPPEAWYITATYRDFLGRIPDTDGYRFWLLSSTSVDDYVRSLASSDEWVGRIVSGFYQDVFGRSPDPAGFVFWAGRLRAEGVPAVASELYGSGEYLLRNGGSTTGFVQGLYRELLGRDASDDPAGVAFWVAEADRRGRVPIALAFYQSEEKRRGRVRDLYCTLLDRPPDSAGESFWADVIGTEGDLVLARNLATSGEYLAQSDEFALAPVGQVQVPAGC